MHPVFFPIPLSSSTVSCLSWGRLWSSGHCFDRWHILQSVSTKISKYASFRGKFVQSVKWGLVWKMKFSVTSFTIFPNTLSHNNYMEMLHIHQTFRVLTTTELRNCIDKEKIYYLAFWYWTIFSLKRSVGEVGPSCNWGKFEIEIFLLIFFNKIGPYYDII